jgi:hypothetical protein
MRHHVLYLLTKSELKIQLIHKETKKKSNYGVV